MVPQKGKPNPCHTWVLGLTFFFSSSCVYVVACSILISVVFFSRMHCFPHRKFCMKLFIYELISTRWYLSYFKQVSASVRVLVMHYVHRVQIILQFLIVYSDKDFFFKCILGSMFCGTEN